MTTPSKPHSPRRIPREQPRRAPGSVGPLSRLYPVITAERAAVADGQLERQQVHLAQRALVDDRVDRVALELGVVAGEVLDRRDDALATAPPHVAGGEHARQQRVLASSTRSSARPAGCAGCSPSARAGRAPPWHGSLAESAPDPCRSCGSQVAPSAEPVGNASRRACRNPPVPAAGAVRSIGHAPARDAEALDPYRGPHVGPGGHRRLLVEGQRGEQRCQSVSVGGCIVRVAHRARIPIIDRLVRGPVRFHEPFHTQRREHRGNH